MKASHARTPWLIPALLISLSLACSLTSPGPATEAASSSSSSSQSSSAGPEVEVVDSFAWTDLSDHLRIHVLLRNNSPVAVDVRSVTAVLFDAAGKEVLQDDGYVHDGSVMSGLGRVLPGETVPAEICFSPCVEKIAIIPPWDHYEIVLDVVEKPIETGEYSTDLEVTVDSVGQIYENAYEMRGRVKNVGQTTVGNVYLNVILYDKSGKFIGLGEGRANEQESLAPGASEEFWIVDMRSSIVGAIDHYDVWAQAYVKP